MNMPVNAHYHVTKECIQRNDPKFIPSQVVVPESFKEKLNNPIYQTLFTQKLLEFLTILNIYYHILVFLHLCN